MKGRYTLLRQVHLVLPAKTTSGVGSESGCSRHRFVRRIAVNHIPFPGQADSSAIVSSHEDAVMRHSREGFHLIHRVIRGLVASPAHIELIRLVVAHQAIETMPVEIQECSCAFSSIQRLSVELGTDQLIAIW